MLSITLHYIGLLKGITEREYEDIEVSQNPSDANSEIREFLLNQYAQENPILMVGHQSINQILKQQESYSFQEHEVVKVLTPITGG